jgi:N-acetylmuramoyl-L-alanine amidase
MIKKGIFVISSLIFLGTLNNECAAQSVKKLRTIVVDAGHGGTDAGAHGEYENSLRSYEKDITLAISKKLVAELKKQLPDVKTIATRTTDVYQNPREKAQIANDAKGDLFLCIHADAVALSTGRRQVGTKTVTRYKVYYTGKGKKKKKHSDPYEEEIPTYEYFKIPTERHGTSIWIFNANKTSDKLSAIKNSESDIQIEASGDSAFSTFNFDTPEGRQLAQVFAKRYQEKSDRIGGLVLEEVAVIPRTALKINQRAKGIWVLQATNMPAILIETGFISNPDDERYLNSEKGQQELAEAITKAVIRYKQQLEGPKTAQN